MDILERLYIGRVLVLILLLASCSKANHSDERSNIKGKPLDSDKDTLRAVKKNDINYLSVINHIQSCMNDIDYRIPKSDDFVEYWKELTVSDDSEYPFLVVEDFTGDGKKDAAIMIFVENGIRLYIANSVLSDDCNLFDMGNIYEISPVNKIDLVLELQPPGMINTIDSTIKVKNFGVFCYELEHTGNLFLWNGVTYESIGGFD